MQYDMVPWSGIPPHGGMHRVHPYGGATIGISPSDLTKSVTFYDAVFGALEVTPQDYEDCRIWGGTLLVRRGTRDEPTRGADAFLVAEREDQIDLVVDAVKAAGFTSVEFEAESNDEHGLKWVTFPDPDGNRVWVTFTE